MRNASREFRELRPGVGESTFSEENTVFTFLDLMMSIFSAAAASSALHEPVIIIVD